MDPLPSIPSPPEHRWREFRIRYLPVIVFLGVLVLVVFVWNEKVSPPTMVGEVESIRANITSPMAGALTELAVVRFQQVKAGQVIGRVFTTDPRLLTMALDISRAESDLLRDQVSPADSQQQILLNYQRLRLTLMTLRGQLAVTRVQLQEAENEFKRVESLFKDKIAAEREFERARSLRDAKREEVAELERIVRENEKTVATNQPVFDEKLNAAAAYAISNLTAALTSHEQKLEAAQTMTLVAPIDGFVSVINRQKGENVLAGEPILVVSALSARHIAAFIRQPLNIDPKPGMAVEVRSRSGARPSAQAKILEVGLQLEPITPGLLPPPATGGNNRLETGLPVLVSLPDDLKLLPGEIVDLHMTDR